MSTTVQHPFITAHGVRLAYTDFGGDAPPLVALHGHFSVGRTFERLARHLEGRWRVIALDQRGHGLSDAPGDYSRDGYVRDVVALIDALALAPAVVLGHSLGGVNAYQLAARHPERVRALVIEDIGAVVEGGFEAFLAGWPHRFPTRETLARFLAERVPGGEEYFLESAAEFDDGWGFRFQYDHMIRSQRQIIGDHWADWLASTCPALLLHGEKSWGLSTVQAREMVDRRPNTELALFPHCGHAIHHEDPAGFCRAVEAFLSALP